MIPARVKQKQGQGGPMWPQVEDPDSVQHLNQTVQFRLNLAGDTTVLKNNIHPEISVVIL